MKSMTGFGSSSYISKNLDLAVSVKCVNNRFLDVRFRIPKEYGALEGPIKKLVAQVIRRGTVDVSINRGHTGSSEHVQVIPHLGIAQKWLSAFDSLQKEFGFQDSMTSQKDLQSQNSKKPRAEAPAGLNLFSFGKLPGVMEFKEDFSDISGEKDVVFEELGRALAHCDQERSREGEALAKEVTAQLSKLTDLLSTEFEKKSLVTFEFFKKKFALQLEKLEVNDRIEESRLDQEIAILLEKCDITEELVRLKEHIKNCQKLVDDHEVSEGKKLDFYMQELMREINTVGAKSQRTGLTKSVIEAKSIIEKIREQVQNLE